MYFYNRTNYSEILAELSPIREKLELSLPFLNYVGMITNLLCIMVFLDRNYLNKKSIFYLMILALSDFLYNFFFELPNFLIAIGVVDYDIFKSNDLGCFFFDLRVTVFHIFSVILTLVVTVERYLHIKNPFKYSRCFFNTIKTKAFFCIFLFMVSIVLSLPHALLMVYNKDEKDCDARDFFRNKAKFSSLEITYYQLYFTFVEPVVVWLIPGIVIFYLNLFVLYSIFKPNAIRRNDFSYYQSHSKSRLNMNLNAIEMEPMASNLPTTSRECENKFKIPNSKSLNLKLALMPSNLTKMKKAKLTKSQSAPVIANPNTLEPSLNSSSNFLTTCKIDKISHYASIGLVGLYLILSTIPYAVVLTFQNNLTLSLNYFHKNASDHFKDKKWIRYGKLRDWAMFGRIFFVSNHCFNFFIYCLCNETFREKLMERLSFIRDFLLCKT